MQGIQKFFVGNYFLHGFYLTVSRDPISLHMGKGYRVLVFRMRLLGTFSNFALVTALVLADKVRIWSHSSAPAPSGARS
jgi:hypothetical protein